MSYLIHFVSGKTLLINEESFNAIMVLLDSRQAQMFQSFKVNDKIVLTLNIRNIEYFSLEAEGGEKK